MPSINLKHRASIHNAEAASFSLHRMHMESYADAISALLECFEAVSEERHQLRQQVALLREAASAELRGALRGRKQLREALAATDPNQQQ